MLLVLFGAFVAFVIAENRLSVYTALATGGSASNSTSLTGGINAPSNL